MISVLFGTISAFCFGISNAYWKSTSREFDFTHLVIYRGIISSFFFGLLWVFIKYYHVGYFGVLGSSADITDYIKTILLCFLCSFGLIFFLSSLKYQQVSITAPLTSVNIFSVLTAVFVLGETFNLIYFFAFSLTLFGILLTLNFKFNSFNRWSHGATYAVLASFFWGITYPLFKFVSPILGAIPLAFILESCVTCSAIVWASTRNKPNSIKPRLNSEYFKHAFVLACLLIGGTLFFNLAIQNLSVLSLNILGHLQLIVSVSIGIFFYREKLTLKQIIGISLILISILLTQYFS
jgi:drug/metabolite transporter (DMT)-like permease